MTRFTRRRLLTGAMVGGLFGGVAPRIGFAADSTSAFDVVALAQLVRRSELAARRPLRAAKPNSS